MTDLTRRHALTAAAALAATPLLAHAPARAAAPPAEKQAPSFYRYKVGDAQVNVVTDGAVTSRLPDNAVANAKRDDVVAVLEQSFLSPERLMNTFTPVVINSGGKLIVVDTGNGAAAFAASKGNVGQFATNLAAAGIDPKNVDTVVISHFHGDHINGLLTADNQPVYPNAEVMVPAVEWKYWMDDGEMSRANERIQNQFKNARRVFEAGLNKKVTPYEWGKDVVPGLLAMDAAGHTPGHTAFVLSSGNDKVLIQSDTVTNATLFATNPGWHSAFDQDGAKAEATRRKIMDMLVSERMRTQGYHHPFPSTSYVERAGDGYRLVPVPWSPVI